MAKRLKLGLIGKIMFIAVVSIILMATALVCISIFQIRQTYQAIIVEELRATGKQMEMLLSNSDGSIVGMCFTGRRSEDVSAALVKVTESSQDITGRIEKLQGVRDVLDELISSLSSTFQLINQDAERLRTLAEDLTETISYFS